MKKTLLFISCLLSLNFGYAQDGINYQGAATDANGDELTNQSISIRASVLSTSANGNLEWEETHSTTTDQFGLFNVVIGQGTNTTNGVTANFDDMDWGSGNHFLKIEMDATGGTNYAMIGTTQMMSVPYALYAKSAGIDSTMLANMIATSGGMGGGGCDYNFPEGFDGVAVTNSIGANGPYTVPNGKRLYVLTFYSGNPTINGFTFIPNQDNHIILNAGDTLSKETSGGGGYFNGFLVDEAPDLIAVTHSLSTNGPYTVPNGKRLYVLDFYSGVPTINGIWISMADGNHIILNAGDTMEISGGVGNFNGYLVDENYFANCGGGSSSGNNNSNTSINDTVYSGVFSYSFSNNFGNTADTISIPYIEGKDIFLTANNLMALYSCSVKLRIIDDNGIDISAKVIGSIDVACTSCPAGYSISNINQIIASSDNNTVSAIIRPYNLNTANLYLFFELTSWGNYSATGTMSYQY